MMKKLRYLCTLLLLAVASGVWAEDVAFYTLDTTVDLKGSNNSYASTCDVTSDGIKWNFMGNTQQNPWRIGGKNLSGVDRTVYTKTAIKQTVTKLVLTLGENVGVTINSLTLTVASDADFSNKIKEVTIDEVTTEGDNVFTPSAGEEWKNAYYKFTFNVTVSENSNKFFHFSKVTFYKEQVADEKKDATITIGAESIEIGETTEVISDGPAFTLTAEGDAVTISGATITGVKEGTATINVAWAENEEFNEGTATFTITVTDPNGPGTESNPFTVEEAISFINKLGDNTLSEKDVYVSGIVSQVDQYVGNRFITYWISDDGTTTTQLEVYKGLGLGGDPFTAITDLGVGDKVTVCGKVKLYKNNSGTVIIPEFDAENILVSFEGVTRIVADDEITLEYNATSGEIPFSVLNQGSISLFNVDLEAGCDWISDLNFVTSPITFKTTVNDGSADRSATITLHHNGAEDKVVTVTQKCNPDNAKMVIEEEDKITFFFNAVNNWDFPTEDPKPVDEDEFTADGYTIKVAGSTGNGYKYDEKNMYLLIGKEGAYLTLPAFEFPVSQIVVEGRSGASGNVKQNIFVGDKAVSTETTGATGTNTYEIASDYQAAGKIYTLKVTNAYNTQITKIIVYKGEEPAPTSVTVTIGESGYSTLYYSDKAFEIPEGVKVTYVSGLNGKKLVETQLTDVIPAGTGVILNAAANTYEFLIVDSDEEAPSDNMLFGTDENQPIFGDSGDGYYYYKLVEENGVVGFWWGAEDGGPFENTANKAYLKVSQDYFDSDPSGAKNFISFAGEDFGVTTAINSIEKSLGDAAIYNLNGVRVNKVQKGVYVVNGKKVVIK